MRTARRSSWEQGIRINYIAPCWIKSAIRTQEYEDWLTARGIEFGEQEDVANCMMRITTDRSVNGTSALVPLSLCALSKVERESKAEDLGTGKSLMFVPLGIAKEGYMDIDKDDYTEADGHDGYFKRTQDTQLAIIEDKWLDDFEIRVYKK